jgi:protein O-mannosyl-transferase
MAKYQAKKPIAAKNQRVNNTNYLFQSSFDWIGNTWQSYKLPLLIIMVFAGLLYAYSATFDYVLDDKIVIQDNKFTQKGFDGIKEIFAYESFRGYFGEQKTLLEGDRYRPLSIATFAAEQSIFGGNKAIRHLINVLLYALTGFLLFVVLRLLFRIEDKEKWWLSVPFVATLLFIAHPLHVEVVANIKGRDEIMTFIGELLCIYFTFKYLSFGKNKYLIFSGIAYFFAILSKESALTFLAVVPLTVYFFSNTSTSRNLRTMLPIIIATVIYMMMRFRAIGYFLSPNNVEITDVMNNPFFGMSISEKFATIFYTLGMYLKLLIFPSPLTHDYYPYQIPKMNWSDMGSILSLGVYIILGLIALWGIKKKNIYSYAIAFYLLTLSIVSNLFVSVGTFMNDRFVYHASIGFCIAIAYFACKSLPNLLKQDNSKLNIAGGILIGILLMGFTYKTIIRLPDWKNTVSLNDAAIQVSPNSARANLFYGVAIWENKFLKATEPNEKKKILNDVYPYFKKAVDIYPDYGSGWQMMAGCQAELHKFDNDYDKLLPVFDKTNRLIDLDFITKYIAYCINSESVPASQQKIKTFLEQQIQYFSTASKQPQLEAYKSMLPQLVAKMQ